MIFRKDSVEKRAIYGVGGEECARDTEVVLRTEKAICKHGVGCCQWLPWEVLGAVVGFFLRNRSANMISLAKYVLAYANYGGQ